MGKIGISAGTNLLLTFTGLHFSEDTIDKLIDIQRSFPKERRDELTARLWEEVKNKEELTEEEALRVLEDFEASL